MALRATTAGWKTSPSQVVIYRRRRVLSAPKIQEWGRGKTRSEYEDPEMTLSVLIELRRASTEMPHRQHRAIVLAWIRGANIKDEGLREALDKVLTEIHTQTVGESLRETHRSRAGEPFGNASERRAAVQAAAAIVNGEPPAADGLQRLFRTLVSMLTSAELAELPTKILTTPGLMSTLESSVGDSPNGAQYPPSGMVGTDLDLHIDTTAAESLMRKAFVEEDLSMTAITAFADACPRETLDRCRDVIRQLSLWPLTSPQDELRLITPILGFAMGVSAFRSDLMRGTTL